MKKIILSSVLGVAALALVGCGTSSQDSAIKNLSNQLDRVTNTVGSMTTSQYSSLAPVSYNVNDFSKSNQTGYIDSQIAKLNASAYEQEAMQDMLLEKSATLKAELGQKLKLSKQQVKALNGLTNSISKYTTNLNSTKSDINSSVKMIRKNTSTTTDNSQQMGAYYQSLNNHLDARLCYFRNLLNTIDQIENIIGCKDCENAQNNQTENNSEVIQNNTVAPQTINQPIVNNVNGHNDTYNYNNGYNNGYYNNGYNYNRQFNPSRNTDTYRPRVRNIDTYRVNPNNTVNNGYNYNTANVPVNNIQPTSDNTDVVEEKMESENKATQEIKNNVITKNKERRELARKATRVNKETINKNLQKNNSQLPEDVSKTQEVRSFMKTTTSHPTTTLEVDHAQTNKKIEKLIRG